MSFHSVSHEGMQHEMFGGKKKKYVSGEDKILNHCRLTAMTKITQTVSEFTPPSF